MKTVRVVAGAIVRGRAVLAALRGPGMRMAGFWELPGGKVEPGEDDATALARELAEELGLWVRVGDFLGEVVHDYPALRVHLLAYRCEDDGSEPVLREHAEVRWVEADGLDALEWAPADRPLLLPLRQSLGS